MEGSKDNAPLPTGDIPVCCVKSGSVHILSAVLKEGEDYEAAARLAVDNGKGLRVEGKTCAWCAAYLGAVGLVASAGHSCWYRSLVGPLFVPR